MHVQLSKSLQHQVTRQRSMDVLKYLRFSLKHRTPPRHTYKMVSFSMMYGMSPNRFFMGCQTGRFTTDHGHIEEMEKI
jgi:hypothetical protein